MTVKTTTINAGILTRGAVKICWATSTGAPTSYAPKVPAPRRGVRTASDETTSPADRPSSPRKSSGGSEGAGVASAPSGGGSGGGGGSTGGGGHSVGGGASGSGQPVGNSGPLATDPSIGNTPVGGPISRKEILERARYWARQGVPYSMSAYTNDPQGKSYRTDCSGLASMALHLDTSLNTTTLLSQVDEISKDDLKPGDLIGNLGAGTGGSAGHVMVFAGWADESRTKFHVIEETPPRAVEQVRTWGSDDFTSHAWRYKNVTD